MAVQVYIDGIEISVPDIGGTYAITGSVTRRLNRPAVAEVTIPMPYATGSVGSRLKVVINGELWFHGMVLLCETDTGEDSGTTVYNAQDPMELWQWRVVRDADGDFSLPTIIEVHQTGPQIIQAMLQNSEDAGDIPDDAEGPLFLEMGGFEGGGAILEGAPTDWPMTIAELASLLISTGEVDCVLTPIDSGINMARIDCYNGDYGTNRSGEVIFQYGMGAHNIRQLRWNQDMTNMCNKLWYYLGPRVLSPADPAGDQHWRANVTGSADGVNPNPLNHPPYNPPQDEIIAQRLISQALYGVRMQVQIFDARGDESTKGRDLYQRLWQIESWVRQQPRELVHITPTRETAIGDFDIGDLVTVEASTAVRGGFSGVQRIYEYTVSWDQDGVLAIDELQTSPNSEGI